MVSLPALSTLKILQHGPYCVEVALNRPKLLNAMSALMFAEIHNVFSLLHESPSVRSILLTGGIDSRAFTSGLDLVDHANIFSPPGRSTEETDEARRAFKFRRILENYQTSLSSISSVRAPVIAAIHGACIGGGVDLVACADIRLASQDAMLKVAENKIGLCPDLGTLQRLPRLTGSDSWVREICFTARDITASEAHARGLISTLYPNLASLREGALAMALGIAALSPVAVLGCKANSRDNPNVSSALAYQTAWSSGALLTSDIARSVTEKTHAFNDVP